ncbi:MAG: hypothetical protein U9Q03_05985 [Patescibacteria group bacterium]|nr:hypothetical protein [Patescibacteria group bacterium]
MAFLYVKNDTGQPVRVTVLQDRMRPGSMPLILSSVPVEPNENERIVFECVVSTPAYPKVMIPISLTAVGFDVKNTVGASYRQGSDNNNNQYLVIVGFFS